jgi:hypothetical protein
MLALLAFTTFLGASLTFLLQPLVATGANDRSGAGGAALPHCRMSRRPA